ncbi:MAG: hypothetical protein ACRD2L_23805 [Terriglobia bacterium]
MKRLTILSITLMALVLTSELATAERGGGRSGGPAGPPPMSERGQTQNRSSRPVRETNDPSSVNHGHQTQPKMTVGTHLEKNTHLATQLQGLFPPGTDLQLASSGFKNLGQFVAAAHVSKNLGIPFDQLKSRTTGDSSVSLGKAIQELRPEADASGEVKKAERQAKEEIKQAETTRKTKAEESEK